MMCNHRLWIAAVLIFVCRGMFVPEYAAQEPRPYKSQAVIDRLIAELGSDSFAVREAAGKELVRIGKPARAALKSATTSKDVEVRRRAKTILRQMDDALARQLVNLGAVVRRSRNDGAILGVSLKVYEVHTDEDQELFDERVTKMRLGSDLHPTTMLEFDPQRMTKSVDENEFSVLAELPSLESLSIEGPQFSDVVMKYVAGHSDLQHLTLKSTHLTDEGCKYLADFGKLQSLTLEHLSITDAGCRHLPLLKTVRRLSIHDVPITDSTLSKLGESHSLERLYLTETRIAGTGLSFLPIRLALSHLMLASANTRGVELGSVKRLATLKSLSLIGGRLSDQDVAFLPNLTRLTSLRLECIPITSSAVAQHITKLDQLTNLNLTRTYIDDQAILHVAKMGNLSTITMSGCKVTSKGLKELRRSTSLRNVRLYDTSLTLDDIQSIQNEIRPIKVIWKP